MSARISSVRRVSSHIFTKNFENIERETFFSVDSCRQFPPSYVYGPGARFFSRLRCFSPFFPRPARSLVNLVSAICTFYINFVSLCSKLRVTSFQTHPLSPLYIRFVRSPFDRQHGGDRFSTLYQLRLDSTELDSFDYRFRDRIWRSS